MIALQYTIGSVLIKSDPQYLRSSISSIIEMTLQSANERAMYSDIVAEVSMWVCNFVAQMMGQSAYVIIQPERELAADGFVSANEQDKFPQQLLS